MHRIHKSQPASPARSEMTVVLIKSKLLNLMASGEGSAPQRGGLLLRDRNSLAYGAERGHGDSQKIADTVLSTDLLFHVCSLFATDSRPVGRRSVLTHDGIIRICSEMGQCSVRRTEFLNSGRGCSQVRPQGNPPRMCQRKASKCPHFQLN